MIFSTSPVSWDGYSQLNPESINRAILQAVRQLEEQADTRFRYFDMSWPITSLQTTLCELPVITGFQYLVERVTVSGTYTGQPTISWQMTSDSDPQQTITLAPDGFDGARYTAVLLPGVILDGYTAAYTHVNNLIVSSSAQLPNMRVSASCRSTRGRFSDNGRISPAIDLFQDGEVITAARLQGVVDSLNNFATSINPTTVDPQSLYFVQFRDLSSTIDAFQSVCAIPGLDGCMVNKVVGLVHMDGVGSGGQTVTLDYGFGNYTDGQTILNVDGLTSLKWESANHQISNASRSLTSASEDFQIRVTVAASTAVKRIEIFVLYNRI
jgi:hypothetical protein